MNKAREEASNQMAANDTRRLRVVVTGDSDDAQQALEQVGTAADESESRLMMLTRTLAGFAAKGAVLLGAVGAAAVTMGVSTASQLEQVEVGFTTMLGSAEKARKFMKQLQDFAAATPFEFTELVGSAQRFLAMGFAAKEVIPMLTAVGDAVAAMGGSAESVDAVTRALGQMQAKGKVSGEELMQLTEQGIPALKILADSYGVTTSEMSEMITKGKVMSDKAIPLLIKGLQDGTKNVKGFGGMMDKQSQTMQGKWSTFMDTLKMGLGNLAKNLLPAAKVAIDVLSKGMSDFFAGIQGKGKLEGFSGTINEIGLGLRAMVGAFKEGDVTSKGIVGNFEFLAVTVRELVKAFKEGEVTSGSWRGVLERMAAIVHELVSAAILLGQAVGVMVGWFRQHETITKTLLVTLAALVALTKVHAFVMGVQAAGGAMAMLKSLTLVASITKVVAAVQWAYNGALAAAGWIQIAGYLAAVNVQMKIMAALTKVQIALQWAWNAAQALSPTTWIILGIIALVAAVVLLWKKSDTFRNWVLGTLWPSLKKAWEQLQAVFWVVVNSLIAAWNWLKNGIMTVWNAVVAFLRPIVQTLLRIFTPIASAIMKIGQILMAFYIGVWKVIWIAIQVAVKIFMAYFTNVVLPAIRFVINTLVGLAKFLWNMFKANWDLIKKLIGNFVTWLNATVVPKFKYAWLVITTAVQIMRDHVTKTFNLVRDRMRAVFQAIAGPISAVLNRAITTIRGWLTNLKNFWNGLFDGIKNKSNSTMDAVKKAFEKGKNGIKAAWDQIVNVTKKPINFVIQSVYNDRIRALWNKVAEKFGIKTRLDTIPKLAKGGVVGSGYGTRDDQLALMMRGEGVLTTKEMKKLGGPAGFQEFRSSLAMYGRGGVVGQGDGPGFLKSLISKGKDIFQGIAGSVIKPLVSGIRSVISSGLPNSGFGGLMKGGANTILNNLVSWVAGKDKEIGAMGGAGGAVGYRAMQALIKARFPQLTMWSGFRRGARTLSGNPSYHGMGRAVDYAPNRALAAWIRATFGSKTKELISPWNDLNLNNGRPHRYTGAVWNQHNFAGGNAHVHWAMDGASTVDPGWFMGYNGTGKPETLVNSDKIPGLSGVTINGGLHLHGVQDVKGLRDELIKLGKRNGGKSGLPN
jgi:tape measure domain-containing protein